MTLTVLDPPDRRIVITCDHGTCTARTDSEQAAKAGGLLEMGWMRRFNNVARRNEYFCPEHKEEHRGY